MCITKKELDSKVQEYREMKTLLEQVQNEVDAIKAEITLYMVENEIDTEITVDGKVTYKDNSRSSFNEDALKEALNTQDLKPYKKTFTFKVLRIK